MVTPRLPVPREDLSRISCSKGRGIMGCHPLIVAGFRPPRPLPPHPRTLPPPRPPRHFPPSFRHHLQGSKDLAH